MFSHLLWLALLAAQVPPPGSTAASKAANYIPPNYIPPDVQLPEPLYTNRPETGGPFVNGGWGLGLYAGPWWGGGWLFSDGSAITGSLGHCAGTVGLSYRKPIYETESLRTSVVLGTTCGVYNEWYLGRGFAARLNLECSLFPFRAGLLHMALNWFPVEAISLSVGVDPLRGGWSWVWALIM